jgi:hypothetical protein
MTDPSGVRYVFDLDHNGCGNLTITSSAGVSVIRVLNFAASFNREVGAALQDPSEVWMRVEAAQTGEFKMVGTLDFGPVNNPKK